MAGHPVLAANTFLVKEHVGLFKAANNYDIFDPATGQLVLECREPNLSGIGKWLRFTEYKRYTPFDIEVRTPAGDLVVQVVRGWTFIRSKVDIEDSHGLVLGTLHQILLSLGGAFEVKDPQDQPIFRLQGKWTSWEFSFKSGEKELAKITKKWAGLGKELLTTADNYVLDISPEVPKDSPIRLMILGSVMCIDMVLKER